MYVPKIHAVDDEAEIRRMVAASGTGWLVSNSRDGTPVATLLPIMWKGSTVIAHMARANGQWRDMEPDARALLIVSGPDTYVSPSWYASKAEDGRVVPTWNYSAVHLTGTVRVHHDSAWVRDAVAALTDLHERDRDEAWAITDAPEDFIDAMLLAVVGVELEVEHVDAKAKLSQNRSEEDQRGVVEGLGQEPDARAAAVAAAMRALRPTDGRGTERARA